MNKLTKLFLLLLSFVFLFSSTGDAVKKSELGKLISLETKEEYCNRMIDTIKEYIDRGYYTEASFLLSDLSKTMTGGEAAELENKLKELYSPEKENSYYNTDVIIPVKDFTGKYGYIDNNGDFVISAQFDKVNYFYEGLALVEIDEKRFFIDREGKVAIELTVPEKMRIEIKGNFHNGLARCYRTVYRGDSSKQGYFYIDKTGEEVFMMQNNNSYSYECWDFFEGFAAVKDKKKHDLIGFINTKGEWLVEPTFKDVSDFRDGMAFVKYPNTNKYGYIDTTGELVIRPFVDDWVYGFLDGVAWVSTKDGFLGQIDKSGNRIFDTAGIAIDKKPCHLALFGDRSNGLTGMRLNDKSGKKPYYDAIIFIDKNNKRVLQRVEKEVYDRSDPVLGYDSNGRQDFISFSNGRAFIKTRYDGWAMIDMKGNFIVKPQIDWAPDTMFTNGLARITFRDKNIGYINRDGKIVFRE